MFLHIVTVQSSIRTFFHNASLFLDTCDNAQYSPPYSLIRTPYLAIIASNEPVYRLTLSMDLICWVQFVSVYLHFLGFSKGSSGLISSELVTFQ